MPLFNASILTGSQQNTFANIQFGAQADGSGAGVLSSVTKPYNGSASPTRPYLSTDTADTLVLNDPAGVTKFGGAASVQVNATRIGTTSTENVNGVAIRLLQNRDYKITLTQQYSSYGDNVDGCGLKLVDFQILAGGGYAVQPIIMDLATDVRDSAGWPDDASDLAPVGTSATFTTTSSLEYITVVLSKKYLGNGNAFTTGTVRFILELV
jgi:hypothetical protein